VCCVLCVVCCVLCVVYVVCFVCWVFCMLSVVCCVSWNTLHTNIVSWNASKRKFVSWNAYHTNAVSWNRQHQTLFYETHPRKSLFHKTDGEKVLFHETYALKNVFQNSVCCVWPCVFCCVLCALCAFRMYCVLRVCCMCIACVVCPHNTPDTRPRNTPPHTTRIAVLKRKNCKNVILKHQSLLKPYTIKYQQMSHNSLQYCIILDLCTHHTQHNTHTHLRYKTITETLTCKSNIDGNQLETARSTGIAIT